VAGRASIVADPCGLKEHRGSGKVELLWQGLFAEYSAARRDIVSFTGGDGA
jgi:hypothetical protein